jgi:hypothetical protein
MKKILAVLALIVLAVPAVFAARLAALTTIDETISAQSDAAVGKAIWEACKKRKWEPVKKSDNEIIATLHYRQHVVSVSIAFSKDGYSIAYKDSLNMNYNAQRNAIHPSYLRWTDSLSRDIRNQLYKNANPF